MAQADPQNILVIHFGQLGDVVLGLPALRAVRDRFAGSEITLLVGKSAGQVAQLAGVADEYILVDRVELRDGNKLRSIGKILALGRDVRRRRFDLVIDLHSLSETNLLGFLAGIKGRLYANRESRSLDSLSNFRPRPAAEDKSKHITDRYFDVLVPLGIENAGRYVTLRPDANDVAKAADAYPELFGDGASRFAGLFPGAGNPSRRWNLKNFASLASRLAERNVDPVVFLGPEETGMKAEVVATFPANTVVVDGLNLAQFIAAISKMSLFIANDTGPVHLAAASGVPIVLLLDERAPTTYLPLTDDIRVIRNSTIDEISVEDVYNAAGDLLPNDKSNPA